MLRMQRVHDHLLLEEEFVENQERLRKAKAASVVTPSSAGGDSDALDAGYICELSEIDSKSGIRGQ